jgi:hypothetical protein
MILNRNTKGIGEGAQNKISFPMLSRIILLVAQIVPISRVQMDYNERKCVETNSVLV